MAWWLEFGWKVFRGKDYDTNSMVGGDCNRGPSHFVVLGRGDARSGSSMYKSEWTGRCDSELGSDLLNLRIT